MKYVAVNQNKDNNFDSAVARAVCANVHIMMYNAILHIYGEETTPIIYSCLCVNSLRNHLSRT